MNYYIDIIALSDSMNSNNVILSKLFYKLHERLVAIKNTEIGISFPYFTKINLGNCLRIHGREENLINLMKIKWLFCLKDYVHACPLQEIPCNVKYRVVKRKQLCGEFRASTKLLNLPYLCLKSSSNKQYYYFFIDHTQLINKRILGKFNEFGVSKEATIPWF